MLSLRSVSASYGDARVLHDVSLDVAEGEAVGLVGRNGSGKSTTFRSIVGLMDGLQGKITLAGEEVSGRSPYEIARAGIALVPEDRRIFSDMTVEENLIVGAEATGRRNPVSDLEDVYGLFPNLAEIRRRRGGLLSGGEQQMLSIGRALMTRPRLLILDEPTEGLAPVIVAQVRDRLLTLKSRGMTLLVSEQSLHFLTAVADRSYVLDSGMVRYEGVTAAIWQDEELMRKYLTV